MQCFKRSIRSFLWLTCLSLVTGCGGKTDTTSDNPPQSGNAQDVNPKGTPSQTDPAGTDDPDVLKVKPDAVMDLETMLGEWKKDMSAFFDKYSGKVLEVSGTVTMYGYQAPAIGTAYLMLGSTRTKFECVDLHPMSKAMPGQKVTLRGWCKPGVGINRWSIARVEGEPPPTLSAEELSKLFATDAEGTTKKYREGYLVVTGTIFKVEENNGTDLYLTPVDTKPAVICSFGGTADDVAKRNGWYKVGQPVRVLGMLSTIGPELNSFAVVLPPSK